MATTKQEQLKQYVEAALEQFISNQLDDEHAGGLGMGYPLAQLATDFGNYLANLAPASMAADDDCED